MRNLLIRFEDTTSLSISSVIPTELTWQLSPSMDQECGTI
jgi:hypothetical protein